MRTYLAIGISDENGLHTWSEHFEVPDAFPTGTNCIVARRNLALEALKKREDIDPSQVLIIGDDCVCDSFDNLR